MIPLLTVAQVNEGFNTLFSMRRLVPILRLRELAEKRVFFIFDNSSNSLLDHDGGLDRGSTEEGGVVIVEAAGPYHPDRVGHQHRVRRAHAGVSIHRDLCVLGINYALVDGCGTPAVVVVGRRRVSIFEEQNPGIGARGGGDQTYGGSRSDLYGTVAVGGAVCRGTERIVKRDAAGTGDVGVAALRAQSASHQDVGSAVEVESRITYMDPAAVNAWVHIGVAVGREGADMIAGIRRGSRHG